MKNSLLILLLFIIGAILGYFHLLPDVFTNDDLSFYILIGLMFSVGLSIGYDKKMLLMLRKVNPKMLMLPLATLVGTLVGASAISIFVQQYSLWECLAVASGLGYYSLSSIFITEYKGADLGTVALVSNIIRELFTIVCAPLLVLWFGKIAPISAAGVASIDTVLPTIARFSGADYVIIAIFHGMALEIAIPFLVSFFCWL